MNHLTLKKFFLTSAILITLPLAGCIPLIVGAAAGAGGIAYVQGTLEKNFDKPVAKLQRAATAGLKDIGAIVTHEEADQHAGKIKAEFMEKEITIDIEALTEKASKIKIRVGVFGDEAISQTVLNAVTNRI
jgi:hypothetical protein